MIPHQVWPIDPGAIWPFLVAVFFIELTPGPNMSWLAVLAATRGRLVGLAAVAGITAGLAFYMVAAAFGIGELVLAAPGLYQVLRWSGVAYLGWLAWEAWRGEPAKPDAPAPDESDLRRAALRGRVANLLNPKAAVFYVTLLPTFIRPDHAGFAVQALTLGSLHLLVALVVHVGIVFAAASAHRLAQNRTAGRIAGIAIAAIAVWMAVQTA